MVKCFKGRHEEVEALLQAGADPRAVSSQRFNELFFAAAVSMQHQNIVRLLIQYAGESLVRASAPCFPGLTARHMACLTGNVVIAKLLIDAGGQNLIDQSLDPLNLGSILNTACENAKVEMAALLVKESPGLLRKTTRLGFTALHTASLLGNLAIAKLLVGADKTLLGRTTLEGGPAASWPASTATPASPSFRVSEASGEPLVCAADARGCTCIETAVQQGRVETVRVLLRGTAARRWRAAAPTASCAFTSPARTGQPGARPPPSQRGGRRSALRPPAKLAQMSVGPDTVPISIVLYIDRTFIKRGIPILPVYRKSYSKLYSLLYSLFN